MGNSCLLMNFQVAFFEMDDGAHEHVFALDDLCNIAGWMDELILNSNITKNAFRNVSIIWIFHSCIISVAEEAAMPGGLCYWTHKRMLFNNNNNNNASNNLIISQQWQEIWNSSQSFAFMRVLYCQLPVKADDAAVDREFNFPKIPFPILNSYSLQNWCNFNSEFLIISLTLFISSLVDVV